MSEFPMTPITLKVHWNILEIIAIELEKLEGESGNNSKGFGTSGGVAPYIFMNYLRNNLEFKEKFKVIDTEEEIKIIVRLCLALVFL